MINSVILVGRLTKDPELKYTPSGVPMARFTVAVNRQFKNGDEQQADFIGCIAWRKQAENLANFMKKGSLIGITGRIQTGSFEGQDGKRVYTTDVIADSIQFLESRSNNTDGSNSAPNYTGNTNYQSSNQNANTAHSGSNAAQQNYTRVDEDPFAANKGSVNVTEDDLPF